MKPQAIQNQARQAANEAEAFFYKTTLANPNKSMLHGDIISLGGVEVKIFETPGHPPYNMSVFIEPEGVLYCGECVVKEYLPNLEAGERQDWINWIQALDTIEYLNPDTIVPGHGDIIVGKQSITNIIKMLRIKRDRLHAFSARKSKQI